MWWNVSTYYNHTSEGICITTISSLAVLTCPSSCSVDNNIARPSIHGGSLLIRWREVVDFACVANETIDKVIVTFKQAVSTLGTQDRIETEYYELLFSPNSSLLQNYTARFKPEFFNSFIENVPSAEQICNEAALRCQGELFPYSTLRECYRIMSSLPFKCEAECGECWDNENGIFQGDTRLCRALHMLSAKLRPTIHCAHMGNVSVKCKAESCPSSQRRPLEDVDLERAPFDAGLSTWFRILEVVVAAFLCLLPVVTYTWYRYTRIKVFQSVHQQQTKAETNLIQNMSETNYETPPLVLFPFIKCAFVMSLRNKEKERLEEDVIISSDGIVFGGCKLTALVGPSGCGKSSLMKLLCGFYQPHMKLEFELRSNARPALYTPQSTDMWPSAMTVRDILLFVSTMHDCCLDNYFEWIRICKLVDLMEQTFGSLSDGQQQRVHILAACIQPTPSVLFMDEPISALDEESAIACLLLLKNSPVEHAFVLSMHQMTPKLRRHFEKVVRMEPETKRLVKINQNIQSSNRTQDIETIFPDASPANKNPPTCSSLGCFKALLVLWHGQLRGWPVMEIAALVLCLFTAILVGLLGGQSLEDVRGFDFVPTSLSSRIPIYMVQTILGVVQQCRLLVVA